MAKQALSYEEGWSILQEKGINKLVGILDGDRQDQFTSEEYMRIYETVYNLCSCPPCGPNEPKLYDQYKKTFQDYISLKVLPSLRGKQYEILLQELVKRWSKHKTMTRWLLRFFHYLDRYFIPKKRLPTLQQASFMTFYNLIYNEINDQIRDAVITMIDKEREGEQIDQALVKNVLDIYVEMAEESTMYYKKEFEEAMLKDTAAFYSDKALKWIECNSYQNYMLQVEECLRREKDRVQSYLRYTNQEKLLEVVQQELVNAHASKLQEKEKKQLDEASG